MRQTTREHFANIELKPEAFAAYLVGTVGFVQTGTLGPPPHGSPGTWACARGLCVGCVLGMWDCARDVGLCSGTHAPHMRV